MGDLHYTILGGRGGGGGATFGRSYNCGIYILEELYFRDLRLVELDLWNLHLRGDILWSVTYERS